MSVNAAETFFFSSGHLELYQEGHVVFSSVEGGPEKGNELGAEVSC
jgi:hypothetical protein